MLKNKRKAQGMPINTIIIAVIALAVLVVLIFIFTGKIKIFSSTLEDCYARQGNCKQENPGCGSNEARIPNVKCPADRPVCCIQILESPSQNSQV